MRPLWRTDREHALRVTLMAGIAVLAPSDREWSRVSALMDSWNQTDRLPLGADGGSQHSPARQVCAGPANGLCRTVPGAYMPGWQMPMNDAGSMGSATDADEDAVTGLIYLAELLDDDEARRYAVKSIAAFVLEDLGLANRGHNSRRGTTLTLSCRRLTVPTSHQSSLGSRVF